MSAKVLPKCFFYTPASQRVERLSNISSGEYVTVYDLEDAVPSGEKEVARSNLKKIFSIDSPHCRAVRINSLRSAEIFDDVAVLRTMNVAPNIVILAMVQDAEELDLLRHWIGDKKCALYATIETPTSLLKIDQIARISDGLVFGSGDLSAFFASEVAWENMLHARFLMTTAAARHNIPAIDTVSFQLDDLDALEQECRRVRALGFYGKAAPHPIHIPIINRRFGVTPEELVSTDELIARSKENGGRVFRLGKDMIGPPDIRRAIQVRNRALGPTF